MPDQAEHLRQLVRAHQAWGELAREEESATTAASRPGPSRWLLGGRAPRARQSMFELGLRFWAVRAARRAWSHVGR